MNGKKAIVILLIIFFYPLGIPVMWISGVFTKKTRWIITLSFVLAIILGLASLIFLTSSPGYVY